MKYLVNSGEIVQWYYMNSKDYHIAFTNYKIVNREDGYALLLGEQSNIQIIIYYVNYDYVNYVCDKNPKGKISYFMCSKVSKL